MPYTALVLKDGVNGGHVVATYFVEDPNDPEELADHKRFSDHDAGDGYINARFSSVYPAKRFRDDENARLAEGRAASLRRREAKAQGRSI